MTWRLGHRPGLDGLRGVAVLLVVVGHVLQQRWPNALGSAGVTVFFTLSGFLITSLLLRDVQTAGRVRWGHFYSRRARRLLPAALLMVAIVAPLQAVAGKGDDLAVLPVLGYAANWAWVGGGDLGWLSHMWSLAVEEQFYLLWPVVVALVVRKPSGVLLASLAGIVVSIGLRFALWDGGAGSIRVYFGSDTRADALLVGCALAAVCTTGIKVRVPLMAAVASLVGLTALIVLAPSPYMDTIAVPTLAPAVAAGLIIAVLNRPGWFGVGWLRWWGQRSYGIYLWHFPLIYGTYQATGSMPGVVIAAGVSVGIAELSYRFLEQPILNGRRSELRAEVGAFDVQRRVAVSGNRL